MVFLQLGPGYSGGSVGVPDVGQHSVASRHSAILGGSQEVDVGGYRAHSSTAAQYGGQYSSVYGSAALSSAQQVSRLCNIVKKLCFYLKSTKSFLIKIVHSQCSWLHTCDQGLSWNYCFFMPFG